MAEIQTDLTSQTAGTVLVVDDDPLVLQALQHMLTRMGLHGVCASQWATAIEAIERECPDLILLDVHMPSVDGPTLLAFLREQGVDVPAFIVSASLDEIDLDEMRSMGVRQFVPKPFSIECLQSLILEELRVGERVEGTTSDTPEKAGEAEPGSVPVSSSRRVLGRRWRPKWGRRKQTLRQLIIVGVVCLGMSAVFLFAHFMVNSGRILALRNVIHQNLRAQTEMVQGSQK